MEKNATVRKAVSPRIARISIVLCVAAALLLIPAGPASAGPVAKDGKIHACYRVKGKPKGQLRVVRSARARCRRGERKVAWSAASSSGLPGGTAQGSQGVPGAPGASAADDAALKAQVGALAVRVQALEGLLSGVSDGDLSGVVSTLEGLDNKGLTDAVNAVPAVEALCQQAPELTEQVNVVGAGIVSTIGVLTGVPLIGPIFGGVDIPTALPDFSCTS